jgi:hypothetical protein
MRCTASKSTLPHDLFRLFSLLYKFKLEVDDTNARYNLGNGKTLDPTPFKGSQTNLHIMSHLNGFRFGAHPSGQIGRGRMRDVVELRRDWNIP